MHPHSPRRWYKSSPVQYRFLSYPRFSTDAWCNHTPVSDVASGTTIPPFQNEYNPTPVAVLTQVRRYPLAGTVLPPFQYGVQNPTDLMSVLAYA
eukprot:2723648-Rhodomonas_salina.1